MLNFEKNTVMQSKIMSIPFQESEDGCGPVFPELTVVSIRLGKESGTDPVSRRTSLYYVLGYYDTLDDGVQIQEEDEELFDSLFQEKIIHNIKSITDISQLEPNENIFYRHKGSVLLPDSIISKYDALLEAL